MIDEIIEAGVRVLDELLDIILVFCSATLITALAIGFRAIEFNSDEMYQLWIMMFVVFGIGFICINIRSKKVVDGEIDISNNKKDKV